MYSSRGFGRDFISLIGPLNAEILLIPSIREEYHVDKPGFAEGEDSTGKENKQDH